MRIGATRADLKRCGKMRDAREELNRSVREGRFESKHSIKSLEGMGSSSHDLGAELRMHSFTVNCDTFSIEEKVAAVIPVTSVEVTCSEAMLALSLSTLLIKQKMKPTDQYAQFSAIMVCNSIFFMDVIVRSNNNPVNDMTAPVSWLINDLDKVIMTKSSQSLFG